MRNEEVLPTVKGQNLPQRVRRSVITGFVTSCLGEIEGSLEKTGRQGRRCRQVRWMTLRDERILELDRGSTK